MKPRWLPFLLVWLALGSHIAQWVAGSGIVLCAGVPHQATIELQEHTGCSHGHGHVDAEESDDSAWRIVARHDTSESCPCTDIELRSEPGRVDAAGFTLPLAVEAHPATTLSDLYLWSPARHDHATANRLAIGSHHARLTLRRCVILQI